MLKKLSVLFLVGMLCLGVTAEAFAKKPAHPKSKKVTLKLVNEGQYSDWVGSSESTWKGAKLEKILFNAAYRGDDKIVKKAVEKEAQCLDEALIIAASKGRYKTVAYLATHGAKTFGEAMDAAQRAGHVKVAEYLKSLGSSSPLREEHLACTDQTDCQRSAVAYLSENLLM